MLVIAGMLFLFPDAISACPKCFAAIGKQVLNAYYVSIAFMMFIPFGIVGGIVIWLYRTRRKIDQDSPTLMDTRTPNNFAQHEC
jgi:hypothetical protein